MHKIIFFPENLKKILGVTSKFRYGWVTLNTGIFYLALDKVIKKIQLTHDCAYFRQFDWLDRPPDNRV